LTSSCVPNVASVPSVLSKVYCFFHIVFVLCLVCPMLSVSLLFCLRFIVFLYCLRPVFCVPNVASVPSVLSKVY
jgi:nitrate reductase NapE component